MGRLGISVYPRVVQAAAAAIVLVVVAGLVIRFGAAGNPVLVDQSWHDLMVTARSPAADGIARTLNAIGGTLVMTTVVVVPALVLTGLREWRAGGALVMSMVVASCASDLLKVIVGRARPDDVLIGVAGDAFPSGHATSAAALGVAVALIVRQLWAWALAAIWLIQRLGRRHQPTTTAESGQRGPGGA